MISFMFNMFLSSGTLSSGNEFVSAEFSCSSQHYHFLNVIVSTFLHLIPSYTCKLWNALSARSENPFNGSFGSPSTVGGFCGLAWGRSMSSHPLPMLSFTWKNPRSDLFHKKTRLLVGIIISTTYYYCSHVLN